MEEKECDGEIETFLCSLNNLRYEYRTGDRSEHEACNTYIHTRKPGVGGRGNGGFTGLRHSDWASGNEATFVRRQTREERGKFGKREAGTYAAMALSTEATTSTHPSLKLM